MDASATTEREARMQLATRAGAGREAAAEVVASSGAVVRLLFVEDESIVRQGIAELLGRQTGMLVVAAVATPAEALAFLDSGEHIDVVVSDVMFDDAPAGLDLLADIRKRSAGPPVLLLSSYGEPWLYSAALHAGALGYLLTISDVHEVKAAIESVAAGIAVFPTAAIRDRFASSPPSPREREIMQLVAGGRGNAEIGGRLGIKEKTVESHLTRLFARYGVGSRTELAMLAAKHRWIGRRSVEAT